MRLQRAAEPATRLTKRLRQLDVLDTMRRPICAPWASQSSCRDVTKVLISRCLALVYAVVADRGRDLQLQAKRVLLARPVYGHLAVLHVQKRSFTISISSSPDHRRSEGTHHNAAASNLWRREDVHNMLAFHGRAGFILPVRTHHELQVARTDSTLVTLDVFVFEPDRYTRCLCQSGHKSLFRACVRRNREENPL